MRTPVRTRDTHSTHSVRTCAYCTYTHYTHVRSGVRTKAYAHSTFLLKLFLFKLKKL